MTKQHIEVITSSSVADGGLGKGRNAWCGMPGTWGKRIGDRPFSGHPQRQLFRWRKELCQISAPSVPQLLPVEVVAALLLSGPVETPSPSRVRKKSSMVMERQP